MEYRTLGKTGLKLSTLSFGASSLGGVFHAVKEEEAIRAVHVSLDAGINFIDVSPYYGLTKAETVLGKALKTVKRDRYVLATKVGRYGAELKDFDFSAERVKASVDESLLRMGVDHVDIIQVHDMEFGKLDQVVNETIPALREVVQAGKARFVGVTGLPMRSFRFIIERIAVDSVLSYCHYELNDTALADMIPVLESKNVGIISGSPLGMGLLSLRGTPAWHPAPQLVKDACLNAAKLCKKKGASIEALAIQFALREKRIASTLVGSANPQNMLDNIAAALLPLDETLLAEVLQILQAVHNITWASGRAENN